MVASQPWLDSLTEDRDRVGRSGTAARVAEVLRHRVSEGVLLPGTRLSEEDIGEALGVSRNTLREAFRLLTHERLLEHVFNRGVFVRTLDGADVRELYDFRRILECAAVRHVARADVDLGPLHAAVREGEAAARAGDWPAVGSANIHFHQALGELAGSVRMDEVMAHLLAELRLVFHVMGDARAFHEPYLAKNRELVGHLERGRFEEAERYLLAYFDSAERLLLSTVAG